MMTVSPEPDSPVSFRTSVREHACGHRTSPRLAALLTCAVAIGPIGAVRAAPATSITAPTAMAAVYAVQPAADPDAPLPDTWGVITAERAILRPGPGYMYEVGELEQGNVVRILRITVDGWTLISPPVGVKGFVYAAAVELTDRQVTLGPDVGRRPVAVTTSRAKVVFSNEDDPVRSWKTWYAEPGTELVVYSRVPTSEGDMLLVQMPPRAEVYVSSRVVRPATEAEVRQWRALNGMIDEPAPTAPDARTPPRAAPGDGEGAASGEGGGAGPEEPVAEPEPAPAPVPGEGEGEGEGEQPPAGGTPDDRPPAQPSDTAGSDPAPVQPSAGDVTSRPDQPATGQDGAPQTGDQPPTVDEVPGRHARPIRRPANDSEPATPMTPTDRESSVPPAPSGTGAGVGADGQPAAPGEGWGMIEARVADVTFEEADVMFSELRQTPILNQEIVPLLTMYRRFADDPDQPETNRRVAEIRVKLLRLRLDVQQHARELQQLQQQAERTISDMQAEREQIASAGAFDLVGRLKVSALYNGVRLPMLYRLEDPMSGRTLAYIAPSADSTASDHLGQVVGVVGVPRLNENLNITVVEPTVVRPID